MSDYLFDRTGADPEVAELEHLLGGYAHDAPLRPPPAGPGPSARRTRRWVAASVVVGAAAAAVVIALIVLRPGPGTPVCELGATGFHFQVQGEVATCGGAPSAAGTLPVGSWLETPAGSVADVEVADIGRIVLHGESRLRLVGTGPDQHRLELARGSLSATVVAPPRLFVVDTPVAAAVDLGCAYDLDVDSRGRTHLRVTSGAVSLEGHGHQAYVPRGTEVVAEPGLGPGVPVASDAPDSLRAAVAGFERGQAGAVAAIVAAAGPADTITLWNLLARTAGDDRAAVFARLDELAVRPEWVLDEDVLAGKPQALEDWRVSLEGDWLHGP